MQRDEFYASEDGTAVLLDWDSSPPKRKADLLSTDEQKAAAERLLALPDFTQRLGRLLGASDKLLPDVVLRYSGINVEADALVGSSSLPSMRNSVVGMAQVSDDPSRRPPPRARSASLLPAPPPPSPLPVRTSVAIVCCCRSSPARAPCPPRP
jgi:hypothetical protein